MENGLNRVSLLTIDACIIRRLNKQKGCLQNAVTYCGPFTPRFLVVLRRHHLVWVLDNLQLYDFDSMAKAVERYIAFCLHLPLLPSYSKRATNDIVRIEFDAVRHIVLMHQRGV